MFSRLWQFIRQVIHRMFPFKDVAAVEHIDTPLSNEIFSLHLSTDELATYIASSC